LYLDIGDMAIIPMFIENFKGCQLMK